MRLTVIKAEKLKTKPQDEKKTRFWYNFHGPYVYNELRPGKGVA